MTEESDTVQIRVGPDEWPREIADVAGPQLVVGGPGTGKTEFIVRRAAEVIRSAGAEHLLVLTFSRRGTRDLDVRLRRHFEGSLRAVDVSTFHSFAMRLLETHAGRLGWPAVPGILAGAEQQRLVADMLAGERREAWAPVFGNLLGSTTFAGEVTDFILRCREQLVQPDDLERRVAEHPDWRGLPAFLRRYDAEIRARERIDYGTLLSEAVRLLGVEEIGAATAEQYRYVLVDEYQDTTAAQAAMLKALVRPHGNITASADPYQSIFSFRGTDLGNVERFPHDFRTSTGRPGRRIVLTTSHRVPSAILDAAVRVTGHELPGAAGKVIPAPGHGSVEAYRFEQQVEEAEWIASEVDRLHLEQAIPYARMAVFVRSKRRFLAPLSRALEFRGIPHDRPDARLNDQPAVRFVLDCVGTATGSLGGAEADRTVRRILLGPLFRLPLGSMRDLERLRLRSGWTWPEVIRDGVPDGAPLAAFLDDPAWALDRPAASGLWELWSSLPQVRALVDDPQRADERAAWSSFAQVLDRWNAREPTATLADYRSHANDESFEASPLLRYEAHDRDRLTIATLHQSKGLEFDVVFIADAVDGVFPDLRTRDSLLGVRHLDARLPGDETEYLRFRLQEERRIAYTAMTRATSRVVWTATDSGFDDGRGVPSRFLPLVTGVAIGEDGLGPPEMRRTPITVPEAEAALRRMLKDPTRSAPDRLAAAIVLAEGPDHGLRPPNEFYGALAPGRDDGIVGAGLRLSPSQADLYETCPRRYVLERRLGIGPGSGIHADFGGLIHDVLETVERRASGKGARHATLREALDELDAQLEPGRFGGAPFDEAWRERGRTALTRLYDSWPSHGTVVALEHPLEVDRDGTRWVGRADRIEARDGVVTVVDYKTSKQATPKAEARRSLQLGFYLLASRSDPAITANGIPQNAEMWFPLAGTAATAIREFEPSSLAEIGDRMGDIAAGVSEERWTPTPGTHCARCSVRLVCPAVPEGGEAFAS